MSNQYSSIHCKDCSIHQLCLPYTLNEKEIDKLDDIIQRKRPYQKNERLFAAGDSLISLFAIRSGSFKSYSLNEDGTQQVTAFHLPGDIIGFDAIKNNAHPTFAQALETSMVCEIPFNTVETLSGELPHLRTQVFRLMSDEICTDQKLHLLLNQKNAEEKLASFIFTLSRRFTERGLSSKEFRLSMTRSEIGNYLGLTVETVSRLFGKFQKDGLLEINGKFVTLLDNNKLNVLIGNPEACV